MGLIGGEAVEMTAGGLDSANPIPGNRMEFADDRNWIGGGIQDELRLDNLVRLKRLCRNNSMILVCASFNFLRS